MRLQSMGAGLRFHAGWSGKASPSVLFEQEPEESEGVSHVAGGGAFQNKSHEAGECIMCSRKSKDRCCW